MEEKQKVLDWLEANKSVFKVSALCKKIGLDKGNFSKYLSMKQIPDKHIPDIVKFISRYGYMPLNGSVASSHSNAATISPKPTQDTQIQEKGQGASKKHPLYKKGDPEEGSNAFYFKYGAKYYDDIGK